MKLAILSDIHGNLEALQACLAHTKAQGAEQFAFTGDVVGYGADPLACIEIVSDLIQQGALAVQGNHDAAAVSGLCETMDFIAREAIYWTRTQINGAERQFLQDLPLFMEQEDMCLVHACAENPELWTYITGPRQAGLCMRAAQAHLVFSGHVHQPTLYFSSQQGKDRPQTFYPTPGVALPLLSNRQWLAIVGSVGQPRDGNPAASYAIYDRQHNTLTYFRVPYDRAKAAQKMLAAGLPPSLADRLERGH